MTFFFKKSKNSKALLKFEVGPKKTGKKKTGGIRKNKILLVK